MTVVGKPDEPLPEIHVAADVPTLLLFPADIQPTTLTVDKSRIRVVDTGKRSIIVQAAPDYRLEDRHELAVFFADGQAPARAAFLLVMDPAEVDTRIDVQRPELPLAACPADVQRDPLPEDFVLMGYVSARGVQTAVIAKSADSEQGFTTNRGVSYRGDGWVLADLKIRNLPGRPPWTPRDVVLRGKGGVVLRGRVVTSAKGPVAPGDTVRVLGVFKEPPPSVGLVVALEVIGDDGRSLVFPRAGLPVPVAEGKR